MLLISNLRYILFGAPSTFATITFTITSWATIIACLPWLVSTILWKAGMARSLTESRLSPFGITTPDGSILHCCQSWYAEWEALVSIVS